LPTGGHVRGYILILAGFFLLQTISGQEMNPSQETRRAGQLVREGKPQEAIPIYLQLIRILPGHPELLINLCVAEFKAKQYESAVQHAEAALKLNPDLPAANLFLGASNLELGQYTSAIAPLEAALTAMPADRNARLMLAEALSGAARYEEALKQFQSAAEVLPSSPRVWYGIGQVYEALAKRACREVEDQFPDSAYSWALTGDSYLAEQRLGNAYAAYRRSLAKTPVLTGVHQGLAQVYTETGHPDWAAKEQALESAIRKAPQTGSEPSASYSQCKADRNLAGESYGRLAQLAPSVEKHLHAAKVVDAAGRHREAISEWQSGLRLAPENVQAQLGLAWSFYQLRDYDAVLPLLTRLLAMQPKSAEVNFLFGATLLNMEKPDAAIPYLQAALKQNPQMRAAQAALGQALLRCGRPEEAIPYLQGALVEDSDGDTHFQLFRAFQLTGKAELAKQAFANYQRFRTSLLQSEQNEQPATIAAPPY
jgi:predicted Zn-dependent protease